MVKAGQFTAHIPVQAVVVPLSFVNRYSVMPFESTRMLPNVGLSATMTVSPLPEDDEPVFGMTGTGVLGAAAWVGAACGAQAANTMLRPNTKVTNNLLLIFYLQNMQVGLAETAFFKRYVGKTEIGFILS